MHEQQRKLAFSSHGMLLMGQPEWRLALFSRAWLLGHLRGTRMSAARQQQGPWMAPDEQGLLKGEHPTPARAAGAACLHPLRCTLCSCCPPPCLNRY